jgi:hypothetical protein
LAYSISLAISWPLNLAWLSRKADQPARPFFGNGLRCIFAGTVAALGGAGVANMIGQPLLATSAAVVAAVLLYVAALAITRAGRVEMRQFGRTVRSLVRRQLPPSPRAGE